jgi:hypothetical protein
MKWLLCLLLVLPACKPAPNPERAFVLYDIAWTCGQRDSLTPLPYDWQRYRSKLIGFEEVPQREALFQGGYDDGFTQHPEEPISDAVREYDRDFRRGRVDAWVKRAAAQTSAGYADGFQGKPHARGRRY